MSNHSSSLSAIIFTGTLVQHLETQPTLRLPSTYVGVRRVRPTLTKKRDRRLDKKNKKDDDDDDGWVPNNVLGEVGEDSSSTQNGSGQPANNHNANSIQDEGSKDNNNNSSPKEEIVYKITNPDGTQRRMTKQEKKQLKYKLAQAKRSERKEGRQEKHEELIREQKAGRRERQKAKRLAWRNKKRQKKNADGEVLQRTGADGGGGNGIANKEIVQAPKEVDGTTQSMVTNASIQSPTLPTSAGEQGISPFLDEELATLRGDRRGIPPVMLTPAATRVAQDEGALPQQQLPRESPRENCGAVVRTAAVTTVLDPIVSAQWASQLQQSMVPAEKSRAREDMRPMAYRLVPEVWKRLCPTSLLSSSCSKLPAEDATEKTVEMEVVEEGTAAKNNHFDDGPQQTDAATTPMTAPGSHSFALLRNPSPSFDEDSYAIFRHLQRHSDLHISCGALFGCDFLLYNGRREDQHSFAGLRVYSMRNNCIHSNDDGVENKFPIPSTYDMAGYVRSMNTARKIALVGTVVREDDGEGGTVARVAIVDLALEKVLTAPTHVRKGNVDKRRLVEGAGDFARTKF